MRILATVCALLLAIVGPACSVTSTTQPALWYGGDSISNAFMCPGCTVAQRLFASTAGLRVLSSSVGLNGRTFAQFGREVAHIPEAAVVVVELGTNDFMQGLPLHEMRSAAGDLLDRVRAANPAPSQLYCLGVSARGKWTNSQGLSRADYDQAIAEECAQRGGIFVPIGQALEETPRALLEDGVHISQQGHHVISGLLQNAFAGLETGPTG